MENQTTKRKKPSRAGAGILKKVQQIKAAEKKLKSQVAPPDSVQAETALRRLEKLKAEVELLQIKGAVMQKEYVSAAQVREDAISVFSILKSEIGAQENNLPPLLEGLNAEEMRVVIGKHSNKLLKDLSERIEAIH